MKLTNLEKEKIVKRLQELKTSDIVKIIARCDTNILSALMIGVRGDGDLYVDKCAEVVKLVEKMLDRRLPPSAEYADWDKCIYEFMHRNNR